MGLKTPQIPFKKEKFFFSRVEKDPRIAYTIDSDPLPPSPLLSSVFAPLLLLLALSLLYIHMIFFF